MSTPGETPHERTTLAWQRTALGVLAVAGLLARVALARSQPLLVVPTAMVALAGLALLTGRRPGGATSGTALVALTAVGALAAVALLGAG